MERCIISFAPTSQYSPSTTMFVRLINKILWKEVYGNFWWGNLSRRKKTEFKPTLLASKKWLSYPACGKIHTNSYCHFFTEGSHSPRLAKSTRESVCDSLRPNISIESSNKKSVIFSVDINPVQPYMTGKNWSRPTCFVTKLTQVTNWLLQMHFCKTRFR